MRRTRFPVRPAGLLAMGLFLVLGSVPARAQFPVFYGGQVLTPFGNRGSDGSYLNPSQRPARSARVNRTYATTPTRYYTAPTTTPTRYVTTPTTYTTTPRGTYYIQRPATYRQSPATNRTAPRWMFWRRR